MPAGRINAGTWADKVRGMFGIQGGENPVPSLEELRPVSVVEADRPEWMFAGLEELSSTFRFTGAGGVGFITYAGIRNPPDSGYLAITNRLWARPGAIAGVNEIMLAWVRNSTLAHSLFTGQGRVHRDSRFGIETASGGVEFVFKNNAAPGAELMDFTSFDPRMESYKEPIIIAPGQLLVLYEIDPTNGARTLNGSLFTALDWRLRQLHKGLRG